MANRQIVLRELPTDRLSTAHFEVIEAEAPEPAEGEVLCRTRVLSIDAANRAWMQGATYTAPLRAGQVMAGANLGEVIASRHPALATGDLVTGSWGWQELAAVPGTSVEKVAERAGPVTHHLSVYGATGLTAYFGLFEVGRPTKGETLVVSAAAGAVGTIVGQLGRIAGCRVVGVAGGEAKCRWLVEELGFDAAVDHRAEGFRRALREACPDGIDVYFDNVGGDVLGAALFSMRLFGRIVCCGVVSQYDTSSPSPGPRGVPGLLVTKRLRMEGFIVMDYYDERKRRALDELETLVRDGKLTVVEDVVDGLDAAPEALVDLLGGGNVGKRLVRLP